MALFAFCDGSPAWGLAALIILIAVVVYVLPVSLAFRTAPKGTRMRLAALYVLAIGVSVLFGFVLPGGLDSDSNYVAGFFAGVGVGGATGLGAGLHRRSAGVLRSTVVGALGGGTFLPLVTGGFFLVIAVTGACLD